MTMTEKAIGYADEILTLAAQYVAAGWCQFSAARDPRGMPVRDSTSPEACAWCIGGALERARYVVRSALPLSADRVETWRVFESVEAHLAKRAGWAGGGPATNETYLGIWNDRPGRTQADVVDLLRSLREEILRRGVAI